MKLRWSRVIPWPCWRFLPKVPLPKAAVLPRTPAWTSVNSRSWMRTRCRRRWSCPRRSNRRCMPLMRCWPNSTPSSVPHRACAVCNPNATHCAPKAISALSSKWWETLAYRPKCASCGCSTCATCWVSCWWMNTKKRLPACASMAFSPWGTRCSARPAATRVVAVATVALAPTPAWVPAMVGGTPAMAIRWARPWGTMATPAMAVAWGLPLAGVAIPCNRRWRQMLAGGDPFDPRAYGAMPSQPVALQPAWGVPPAGGVVAGAQPMPQGGGYYPVGAAAEAIEDMAQLERLVGRLASGSQAASLSAPLTGWRGPGVAPVVYAAMPMEAATQSPAMAIEVVGRMMENIAQDARLLPPVQKAVKSLEPALKQLVTHDGRFFTDGTHPARRLLDELTQRSLAFTAEATPGFSSFMRLVQGAVEHLTANEIKDAGPFDTVLKALQSAWETQEQKIKAHQEAQQKALLQAEQREMLAEKTAADIRRLPDLENVPADVLDFAAGPWADVIALAQVLKGGDGQDEDPGGYLA